MTCLQQASSARQREAVHVGQWRDMALTGTYRVAGFRCTARRRAAGRESLADRAANRAARLCPPCRITARGCKRAARNGHPAKPEVRPGRQEKIGWPCWYGISYCNYRTRTAYLKLLTASLERSHLTVSRCPCSHAMHHPLPPRLFRRWGPPCTYMYRTIRL